MLAKNASGWLSAAKSFALILPSPVWIMSSLTEMTTVAEISPPTRGRKKGDGGRNGSNYGGPIL